MNKIEATGRLIKKTETQTFPSGFKKRTFVIEEQNGQWTNPYEFELVKDACAKISPFKKDQLITVEGYVQCREGTDQYAGKYFVHLRAVEVRGATQAPPAQQQAPAQPPAQTYSQPPAAATMPPQQQSFQEDDIPF